MVAAGSGVRLGGAEPKALRTVGGIPLVRHAADAMAEAHYRGVGTPTAERALQAYPKRLQHELGGYYRLGGVFVRLIGHPEVMKLCTRYGLPRRTLMKFTLKLLANLTDGTDGDAIDRTINALTRIAPSG